MHQIAIIFRFARLFYGILYWILNDARENKHEFFTGNYIPFIYQPRTARCAFRICVTEDVSGISGSGLIRRCNLNDHCAWNDSFKSAQ